MKIINKIKYKGLSVLAIFIIGAIIIGIPLLIAFIGICFMRPLGLHYVSIIDLFQFFFLFFLIEFPLGFIASNLPKVLHKFGFISKNIKFILQPIFKFLLTTTILYFLDLLLIKIDAPMPSIAAFSLFYTILDYIFDENGYDGIKKNS